MHTFDTTTGIETTGAMIDAPAHRLPLLNSSRDDVAPFDVAILGGGASGVLVAIHLLHGDDRPLRIAIVEPRQRLAQGVACSTGFPEHLLNVIASRMSAFDDDPQHFVRFLAGLEARYGAVSQPVPGNRFVARSLFSDYLHTTLQTAAGASDIEWIRDEAVDIEPGATARITLQSGSSLRAHHVVLAIGNEARTMPLPESSGDAVAPIEAWDYAAVRAIDPDRDVCIVGSGLSMVDAVTSLSAHGHRGRITVLSRHGLLPLPHARPGSQRGDVDDLLALGTRARLHALRDRARSAMRAGQPWQWAMDAMRHHRQALWRASNPEQRRRFLRHGARFWDIHRHRIVPEVAARLDALRATGQLDARAGNLLAIDGRDGVLAVRYRPRGKAQPDSFAVGCVINATGIETALARTRRPLLEALRARGVVQAGPFGLGIQTDDLGSVIDHTGRVLPALMTLGSARIGALWESVAIPELRVQAQQIACVLRRRIESNASTVESRTG